MTSTLHSVHKLFADGSTDALLYDAVDTIATAQMESLQAAVLALCDTATAPQASNTTATASATAAAAAAAAAAITSAEQLVAKVSSLLAQSLAPVSVTYWALGPGECALQEETCFCGSGASLQPGASFNDCLLASLC
jgi:hypothetical protein